MEQIIEIVMKLKLEKEAKIGKITSYQITQTWYKIYFMGSR